MTVQKLKQDIEELKKIMKIKKETPWDCKCLMIQFRDESLRREIFKKLCAMKGEYYEELGPIQLYYADPNLSREARIFLALSDEEKAEAVKKEFPPKHYTEEGVEEMRRQLIAKINIVGGRLRRDSSAT